MIARRTKRIGTIRKEERRFELKPFAARYQVSSSYGTFFGMTGSGLQPK